MDFKDKIILVTGGTSGIGLKSVISFAKNNARKVYTCGRSIEKWEIAKVLMKKELGKDFSKVEFIQTDIRVESEVRHLIRCIFYKYRQLDIAVNNAGVNIPPVNIWDMDFGDTTKKCDTIRYQFYAGVEDKEKQTPIFTMLYGLLFCLKWELKYILKYNNPKKQVNIVNTSSAFDNLGTTFYPTYTAAKSGVSSLTKSIAGQVAQERLNNKKYTPIILINSVNPGAVLTPLFFDNFPPDVTPEEAVRGTSARIPLNRVAKAQEIANSILILSCNKTTTYMTGTEVNVDGGLVEVPNYNRKN